MTETIVAVEPVIKQFALTWMLGSRCNYDCLYCPAELHDSISEPHELDTMKQVWIKVYEKTKHKNLPYKISFTGGEVTANKNFLPLVKWLRENFAEISMILLTTNGSASQNYYTKLSAFVEAIAFSTHSEFMNEHKFFTTVIAIDRLMIRPQKSVHVNIMNEHWNQDRIALYKKYLDTHGISYSVNSIDYSKGTRTQIIKQGLQNLEI